jgi:hypothetical protein
LQFFVCGRKTYVSQHILDEIVMGGMVLETNIHTILQSVKDQGRFHDESLLADKSSTSIGGPAATGGGGGYYADGPSSSSNPSVNNWQYNW